MGSNLRQRKVRHRNYFCLGPTITPKKIEALQRRLGTDARLRRTKEQLGVLSGGRRLQMLYLLGREPELCVCDMADILGTTVSAVSHQFRVLRDHGLVRSRRDAQTIFYSLTDDAKQQLRRYWRQP